MTKTKEKEKKTRLIKLDYVLRLASMEPYDENHGSWLVDFTRTGEVDADPEPNLDDDNTFCMSVIDKDLIKTLLDKYDRGDKTRFRVIIKELREEGQ